VAIPVNGGGAAVLPPVPLEPALDMPPPLPPAPALPALPAAPAAPAVAPLPALPMGELGPSSSLQPRWESPSREIRARSVRVMSSFLMVERVDRAFGAAARSRRCSRPENVFIHPR